MKIKIQPKQHHESKMTPEELQEYLKMCRNGSSTTKNGRAYQRKPKHNKRLSYCWDFFYKKKNPENSESLSLATATRGSKRRLFQPKII